jgi:hypothetical protein
MCYFEYIVLYYNEVEGRDEIKHGIVCAATGKYSEAMALIEEWYGDELEEVQKLSCIDDSPVYEFGMDNATFTLDI